jgi:hypothetical protein
MSAEDSAKDGARDSAELRAEIESTRADLAETVNALVAKTDVRRRAGEKADEVRSKVADAAHEFADQAGMVAQDASEVVRRRPVPVAAVVAVLVALLAWVISRKGS